MSSRYRDPWPRVGAALGFLLIAILALTLAACGAGPVTTARATPPPATPTLTPFPLATPQPVATPAHPGSPALLTYAGHAGSGVISVAWSPDGRASASGGGSGDDHTVRIWDAATGHPRQIYTGHTDIVFKIAWRPDGKEIASAGQDGTVQLWRPATA